MDAKLKLEHGIDKINRTLALVGEVNEDMYARLLASLMFFASEGDTKKPITIILNTYGGDLYQALGMTDLIKTQSNPVHILCVGPVMSAGTIILQAADVRAMTPQSYLMMHYGQDASDSEQLLLHNTRLLKEIKNLFKTKTKASPRTINGWFTKDTYYNASQCLSSGLVDKVINYEKK